MVRKLYTRKIRVCIDCPNRCVRKEKGKRYSTSKCSQTGLFIATGTMEIPTKEQEDNIWSLPPFPLFCPLEDCE